MTDAVGRTGNQSEHDAGGVVVALALAALLTLSFVAPAAGATTQGEERLPTEPAVVVTLEDDGTAELTLTTTFDLTTEAEREAFEALEANETARDQRTEQFAERMGVVATRVENETGRSMTVRDPAMTFTTRNDTGIVALSVTWEDLARTDGDRLVLAEPFDGGFTTDRSVHVRGPDGYRLADVAPTPATETDRGATWTPGTDFAGFEATFVPADDESGVVLLAGIGVGIVLLAVFGTASVLRYRR